MLEFCTMLDAHFVLRGTALYRSLERQGTPFRLLLLCTDDASLELLRRLDLPGVEPLGMPDLEARFPELAATKPSRGPYEYIATAKPFLIRHALERLPEGTPLSYLDADLCFFDDPAAIERELGDADVLLTPHHFPEHLKSKEENNGYFNAGFYAARNSPEGRKATDWWCERCAEWCYDRVESGKSSNQKYLEGVPKIASGVKSASHPGLNVAPWNADRFSFSRNGPKVVVTPVGDPKALRPGPAPLVFYHFHALKRLRPWLYDTALALYHMRGDPTLVRHVYAPYIRDLRAIELWLRHEGFAAGMGSVRRGGGKAPISPGLLAARLRRRQWLIALRGRTV